MRQDIPRTRRKLWWWGYSINPDDYTEEELEDIGYQIGDNEYDKWVDEQMEKEEE